MSAGSPLLLIVATHPIQYQVPWFRALADDGRIRVRVAFLRTPTDGSDDMGFQRRIKWDIPLLSGYDWCRVDSHLHLVREIRSSRPEVILVLGWNESALLRAWVIAKWFRIPLIVRGDSNSKRVRPAWVRLLHRLLLSIPSRFLSVGSGNAEFYLAAGVASERLRHAPHFVNNEFFSARVGVSDRSIVRSRWGLSEDDFCVLFAGKFEAKKRPFDLLEAVRMLPERLRVRTRVLMVGSGHLEASLRESAIRFGDSVIWAGFLNQSEMPSAYAAADLLVLPSDHGETWGLVVNEAMACGVPVIVSDEVGCANDLVRHGETGLVYPMGEVSSLSQAIESLLENPDRRHRVSHSARSLVTREYTIARSVDVLVEEVLDLTSGSSYKDRRAMGAADSTNQP